jgi:type IV secretory pathway VirB4 component
MLNIRSLIKGYQDSARSIGEILPWMCLWERDTVATVDQGLLAAFTYDGLDAEGKSGADIDHAVNSYERAFSGFGTGSVLWSIVDRRRSEMYPYRKIDHPVAERMQLRYGEEVTRKQYLNKYSLAVYQRSAEGSSAIFDTIDRIVKEEDAGLYTALFRALKAKFSLKAKQRLDSRVMANAFERLEARVQDLYNNMSRLGLRRIVGGELLGFLHGRANPVSGGRDALPMPRIPAFLNFALANDAIKRRPDCLEFSNGNKKKFVGVISLMGWPDERTYPGSLDYLTAIDGEVTVCHVFRFIDRQVSVKAMESKESYNMTAAVPFMQRLTQMFTQKPPSNLDQGRLQLAQDARDAKAEVTALSRAFGYHNMTVLCYGDTPEEMEHVRSQVQEKLAQSFFRGFVEHTHQLSAWSQTLPGQWMASVRWSNVSFGNAADLAPIRTLWSGSPDCPHFTKQLQVGAMPALIALPTDAGVPFNWDPFEAGVGHTCFIGPSRTGKSIFVNLALTQFKKYPGARVIRFDKDYSAYVSTLLLDGTHVDLTPDRTPGAVCMAPIGLVGDPKNHPFLIRWIRTLIEMGRPRDPLTPDELGSIVDSVRDVSLLPRSMHTMSQIKVHMSKDLGRYLDDWLGQGGRAAWFDNEPTLIEIGDEVCFEMKRLFSDEDVAVLAMDYLFYLVEQSLDGRPLVVNVEETWFFLRNQTFVNRLDDFLRTIGKRNGSLWITTQGAVELTGDKQLAGMLEQLKNKVFLPNKLILQSRESYSQLGLSEEMMLRIREMEPNRDYYVMSQSTNRLCNVRVAPDLIPCIDASNRALTTFRRHAENKDEEGRWKQRYLDEMTSGA